jgi:hypothetical protein
VEKFIMLNRNSKFYSLLVLCLSFTISKHGFSQDVSTEGQKVFQMASPSVVVLKTLNSDGQAYKQGSGVVISKNLIVTNCHVLQGGVSFVVVVSGKNMPGVMYSGDVEKDLCTLSVDTGSLPSVEIRSSNTLKIGEVVYAIGSPKGLDLSLSNGLVSQLRGQGMPMIQTTAAISSGSSGGGLFDVRGRLVGITTFKIVGGDSLNFAAPAAWISSLPEISSNLIASSSNAKKTEQVRQLLFEKKPNEAIDFCKDWLRESPDIFEPYFGLGLAYTDVKNYSAAVDAFKKVVSITPDNSRGWIMLANSFSRLGKHVQAIAARKEGLKINPNDPVAWGLLANSYGQNDQLEESVYAKKKELELKENDESYRFLGFIYSLIEQNKSMLDRSYKPNYQDQLYAYRKAVSVGPKNPKNYTDLLHVLERTGLCTEHQEMLLTLKNLDLFEAAEYTAKSKKFTSSNCKITD